MQDLKKGDVMTVHLRACHGNDGGIAGPDEGFTFAGKPFADALFKSWIGPKPGPGEGFKRDLLGGKE